MGSGSITALSRYSFLMGANVSRSTGATHPISRRSVKRIATDLTSEHVYTVSIYGIAMSDAYQRGVRAERARIVKWLHGLARSIESSPVAALAVNLAAHRIAGDALDAEPAEGE